jgi:hypothetical protein
VVSVSRGIEGGLCVPQALHCDLAQGIGYDVKGKATDIVFAEEARTQKEGGLVFPELGRGRCLCSAMNPEGRLRQATSGATSHA